MACCLFTGLQMFDSTTRWSPLFVDVEQRRPHRNPNLPTKASDSEGNVVPRTSFHAINFDVCAPVFFSVHYFHGHEWV